MKPLLRRKDAKMRVMLRLFSSDEGGKEGLLCSCNAWREWSLTMADLSFCYKKYCLVMVWWGAAQLSWFLWSCAILKTGPSTPYPQYSWEHTESPRKVAHCVQCGSLWFRAACHVPGHCVSIDLSLHLLSIYAGFAFVLNIAQTGGTD